MSRFEDNLQRDLTVIADRATPSPDAWASIQQRIADQDPHQETEIIMLTENTTPTRRWPLVAAAAVIAIAIAAIVVIGTGGDDDEVPASPPPTAAPVPEPDGAAPAVPDPEPAATVPPAPRQLSLGGTVEGSVVFAEPAADGTSSFHGTETWSGDLSGTAEVAGTNGGNETGDGLVGTTRRLVTARVDGIGEGMIIIDDQWESQFTGATESTGTVLGGTGDFAGVSGTFTSSSPDGTNDPSTEPVEVGAEYALDLVLPPLADATPDTERVILVGTSIGETSFDVPDEGPATMTGTEDYAGDLVGTAMLAGSATRNEAGNGLMGYAVRVIDATTSDGRSGLIVAEGDWTSKFTGAVEGSGTILGGTGDFVGAGGTYTQSAPDGSNDADTPGVEVGGPYRFELVVPVSDR
jgi:hypothetical protein